MKPFYMVFVNGRSGPSVTHQSLADATEEACRLAKKTGEPAVVLKSYALYQHSQPPLERLEYED